MVPERNNPKRTPLARLNALSTALFQASPPNSLNKLTSKFRSRLEKTGGYGRRMGDCHSFTSM